MLKFFLKYNGINFSGKVMIILTIACLIKRTLAPHIQYSQFRLDFDLKKQKSRLSKKHNFFIIRTRDVA